MGFRVSESDLAVWQQRGLIAPVRREPLPDDCSEKEFQSRVVEVAKVNGWLVQHQLNSIGSEMGWPDLALAHAGRSKFMLWELKSNTGAIRPEQTIWLNALVQCGIEAKIFRPCHWLEIVAILEGR